MQHLNWCKIDQFQMPASKEVSAKVELMSQQGIAVEVISNFSRETEKNYLSLVE
jgi:hypothetical protein